MSYREKKERKRTIEKKERKKEKHLTVVDPETLFMHNSKLIYCPKTCICVKSSVIIDVCNSNSSNW